MKYNPHLGDVTDVFNDYSKLIHHVVHKHFYVTIRKGIAEYDDLFQEGSYALLKAYEIFDPERGSFSSILYIYMREDI